MVFGECGDVEWCLENVSINSEGEDVMKKLQFEYKGVPLHLINRKDYKRRNAKRYRLNDTNQNVWIPNKHLNLDGTLKENENIDYVFRKAKRQMQLAGISEQTIYRF